MTAHDAPGPMWQLVQATRECGESRYAPYSGAMTLWQVRPQKRDDSMYSAPMYAENVRMMTFSVVRRATRNPKRRRPGSARSTFG